MSTAAPASPSTAPRPPMRLGERLQHMGLVSADQIQIALLEQKKTGTQLGDALIALGFVTEDAMREALGQTLGQQTIELSAVLADPQALARVPKAMALRFQVFPVSFQADTQQLVLASPKPNDIIAADQIRAHVGVGVTIIWRLASAAEVLSAIDQFYGYELSIDGIIHEIETGQLDVASLAQGQGGYSHPVVRLVDALLSDAVHKLASDIHFEPEGQFLRIRYRIDGVLRQVRVLHGRYWNAMLVRLKLLAGMNIAESRAPQDGRVSLSISARSVDFRAAVQPTIHGENFVLRVLDAKRGIVEYRQLGLTDEQYYLLDLMLARPEGIILVTGPTGSGKTTTLYSVLNHLNDESVNIMTLEDPVEYPITRIRQTSISDGSKIDFSAGVRSLMRQDPDIILVGEVRDKDTAEMAFRAAMTGHQVFSTLHTNSALRSFQRIKDLGVSPEVMAGNIIGIIAQRLVRRVCRHCRQPLQVQDGSAEALLMGAQAVGATVYRAHPGGCEACGFQGYRGRLAIMELLRMDAALDELITRNATIGELTAHARASGFVPMADDGLRRVLEGITTVEEIGRVVDLTARL
ncbi:GspE/PulE family protein [Melaminivora alkalimesophila]|uniref:General secretion pathway protein E/type IV pilus assembly protein PilB n=1 Tax=Melaminivora alkalimesophila TaxID=1165852 RepID=A0A317RD68_9BURK|nr:GspE/PulE family protein [Melaminivora alkalimesophila]PWW47690.1 general secretion pathway protein E/type IV pilus assembly protein PilB [Melaminivora alkalimesophila]